MENVEAIERFKISLGNNELELKTDKQEKKFYVKIKDDKIFVKTNNDEEFNVNSGVTNALEDENFTGSGGFSYAPVIAYYICKNFLDKEPLDIIGIVNKIKNIILYGVPGVGKTYSHKKLIDMIESKKYSDNYVFENIENHNNLDSFKIAQEENRVKFITFHQSFGYEDFIEGFRPNKEGNIKLQDGVFKEFCQKAEEKGDKNFYLVIDEINRANISKVFGELITLIEEDKRDSLHVALPYSKKEFSIPSNLYIIGTMNSTDKSIALIDIALRRRFTFIHMTPNPKLVKYEKAKNLMKKLNEKLDSEYHIGHSYFMNIEDEKELAFTCKYKIKPLLEEYFYGDKEGLEKVLSIL